MKVSAAYLNDHLLWDTVVDTLKEIWHDRAPLTVNPLEGLT